MLSLTLVTPLVTQIEKMRISQVYRHMTLQAEAFYLFSLLGGRKHNKAALVRSSY